MVPSIEEDEEHEQNDFWYVQVLGIFSMYCRIQGSTDLAYKQFNILWVCWLGRDLGYRLGWCRKRLLRVGYLPDRSKTRAFGFINPNVIHATHLVPAFVFGQNLNLLHESFVKDLSDDWAYFHVN